MTTSREIMWRRTMDDLSFEHARLETWPGGSRVSGTVLAAENAAPLRVEYAVTCDSGWRTRAVTVTQSFDGRRRSLQLAHDGAGGWTIDGEPVPALDGCTDVDLGLSPITNALPVNRLRLPVGATGEIRAAWVRFPSLAVVPAEQSYERLGERRYRYHSRTSGFEAEIEVDDDGLPVDYAGIWRRVAEGPAAPEPFEGAFAAALVSEAAARSIDAAADDFGWLVGGWTGEARDFAADGSVLESRGEWWFARTLEGRAVQDVWIVPPRGERDPATQPGNRYGTSLRWRDCDSGLWHVVWVNPVTGAFDRLRGRRHGDRIELCGDDDGREIRWCFADIRPDSFRWTGESRAPGGDWRLEAEFRLRRMA